MAIATISRASSEAVSLLWSGVEFDPNDNLTRTIDAHYGPASGDPQTGAVTTTSYDLMDRPVWSPARTPAPTRPASAPRCNTTPPGAPSNSPARGGVASATVDDFTTVFNYDPLDRLITQTQYGTDTSNTSTGQTRLTQMCYDLAGDLRSVTTPRAGATITCPGDGPAEATHTRQIDYDPAHRSRVLPSTGGARQRSGSVVLECRPDVGVDEIVALEQQRFAGVFGQCVREAVSEVESCFVPGSFSVVAVSLSCDACLLSGDWFDADAGLMDELVIPAGRYRVTDAVDDDRRLQVVGRGDSGRPSLVDRIKEGVRVLLLTEDGDDCG